MSSEFIALPVGQGDSFYLKRGDIKILFDGGKSKSSIYTFVKEIAKTTEIDILVCSHNDADHANGVIGLLDSPCKVKEVWLPGRWRESLQRISESPSKSLKELFHDSIQNKDTTLEDIANEITDEEIKKDEEINDEMLEESIERVSEFPNIMVKGIHPAIVGITVFKEAIEASKRIIEIATLAQSKGCKIRWFDFKSFEEDSSKQPKGGYTYLKPLNSHEITKTKRTGYTLLKLLALSLANKESLSFISEFDSEPTTVFTADSDLAGVNTKSIAQKGEEILVTAPHHGSEANKIVYSMFNNPMWIRSDMLSKKRPCTDFKKQAFIYCTLCKSRTAVKMEIYLNSHAGKWNTTKSKCTC